MICCCVKSDTNKKYAELDGKLARKMVESRRIYPGHKNNDKNGTIDIEELKKCLEELQLSLSDEEVKGLYGIWCDVDGSKGIQFNEFMFKLIEVFLFLDKEGKGKVNKADVIKTLNNEDYPLERSLSHVTNMRFEFDLLIGDSICFHELQKKWIGEEKEKWVLESAFMSWVGLDDADDYYMSS
ncbi:PREDICTED: probable calcium-binding protein CML22 [Camelina sativa]|uniref:Probable calcium-binding protein CML22 n=1 Tax=Camelina sativa TaxID=90675 RepID=A0ABM0WB63_CAMSA|nr:PREDICTED: probable calcium-binding protein CML22 [Camelina sativa]